MNSGSTSDTSDTVENLQLVAATPSHRNDYMDSSEYRNTVMMMSNRDARMSRSVGNQNDPMFTIQYNVRTNYVMYDKTNAIRPSRSCTFRLFETLFKHENGLCNLLSARALENYSSLARTLLSCRAPDDTSKYPIRKIECTKCDEVAGRVSVDYTNHNGNIVECKWSRTVCEKCIWDKFVSCAYYQCGVQVPGVEAYSMDWCVRSLNGLLKLVIAEMCVTVRDTKMTFPPELKELEPLVNSCVSLNDLLFCPPMAGILHACEQARIRTPNHHFSHMVGTNTLKVHMVRDRSKASAILCLNLTHAALFLLKVSVNEVRFQPIGNFAQICAHALHVPAYFTLPSTPGTYLEHYGVSIPRFVSEFVYDKDHEKYPSYEIVFDRSVKFNSHCYEVLRKYLAIVWSELATTDLHLSPYCPVKKPTSSSPGDVSLYERSLFLSSGTFKVKGNDNGLIFIDSNLEAFPFSSVVSLYSLFTLQVLKQINRLLKSLVVALDAPYNTEVVTHLFVVRGTAAFARFHEVELSTPSSAEVVQSFDVAVPRDAAISWAEEMELENERKDAENAGAVDDEANSVNDCDFEKLFKCNLTFSENDNAKITDMADKLHSMQMRNVSIQDLLNKKLQRIFMTNLDHYTVAMNARRVRDAYSLRNVVVPSIHLNIEN